MSVLKKLALIVGTVLVMLGMGVVTPPPSPIPWPIPIPTPTPTPVPPVDPAPISDEGFRVLLTFKEQDRGSLPPGQKGILESSDLRAWLTQHCAKSPDGVPEWRVWPDAATPGSDQPIWQKMMQVAQRDSKGSGQWMVVSNGKTGVSAPWPADEAALMTVLQKYEVAPK